MTHIRSYLATFKEMINLVRNNPVTTILVLEITLAVIYFAIGLEWFSAEFIAQNSGNSELLDPFVKVGEVVIGSLPTTPSLSVTLVGKVDEEALTLANPRITTISELTTVGFWLFSSYLLARRLATFMLRAAELLMHKRGFGWLEKQKSDGTPFNIWAPRLRRKPPFFRLVKRENMEIVGFFNGLTKFRQLTWAKPRMTIRALVDSLLTMIIVPTTPTLLAPILEGQSLTQKPFITMLAMLLAIVYLPRIRRFAEKLASSWR